MAQLNIGLIGFGRIAQFYHLKILAGLKNVKLAAVAEADEQRRLEAQVMAPAAQAFSDYTDLLQLAKIDAVVICLPTSLHVKAATAALNAGKHVYLEKPLAANLKEGRALVNSWQKSGKIGMIGFNNRFSPLYRAAKQQLSEHKIGKIVAARAVLCSAARKLPGWKLVRNTGGGALLDLSTHHNDLICFLLNQEVQEVSAKVWSVKTEDDNAFLEMTLDSGLKIQGFFSMTAVQENRFEFYGDTGKLVVDRFSNKMKISPTERSYNKLDRVKDGLKLLRQTPTNLWNVLMPGLDPSYKIALSDFVEAIISGQPAAVDFSDGYKSLAIIHAAEQSAKTGRAIQLKDITDYDFND